MNQYKENCKQGVLTITFKHELTQCADVHCHDPGHIHTIDRLYNDIVSALYNPDEGLQKESKK